jgi:hypothetical protein
MKKSKINSEELLNDLNKAFSLVNKLEVKDLKEKDLQSIKKESTQLKEKIKIKYKDYLDTKK